MPAIHTSVDVTSDAACANRDAWAQLKTELMQRAWELYIKKYGFTPKHPITVELFSERQHYGARTIGVVSSASHLALLKACL